MSKKKIVLLVVAVVMLCTVAITGTLAFLTDDTDGGVTNTFVAAEGLIDDPDEPGPDDPYDNNGFFILENEVTLLDDGSYEIADGATLALGNDYKVLPSTNLPKNPFVRINGKTETPAYLYIEVVDTLGEDSGLSYDITSDWTLLDGLTGANGGKIYTYATGIVTSDVDDVAIIDGDEITVDDTIDIPDEAELSFYGYLAQASAGDDAAAAFTACFGSDD